MRAVYVYCKSLVRDDFARESWIIYRYHRERITLYNSAVTCVTSTHNRRSPEP